MPIEIDYRGRRWLIEGETVYWGQLEIGRWGWRCSCWKRVLPERGAKPHCFHSRVVEDAERLRIPIEESGPKVVRLVRP